MLLLALSSLEPGKCHLYATYTSEYTEEKIVEQLFIDLLDPRPERFRGRVVLCMYHTDYSSHNTI